ncbi:MULTISPECIES: hypothetical protein [Cytobacillus]|uniref:hypothetical protein n=1 Tax=Cytobacillus TaxID=2675230 RepID=UPI0013F4B6F9|nr:MULTISPECIES: hypothetical protein [Cytobacillus]
MDFEKIKNETIQELQSKYSDEGVGSLVQQFIRISAATTELMLKKYHEEVKKNE